MRAKAIDIEITFSKMQLRGAGLVTRMADNQIPKQLLCGELADGKRSAGRPLLRWTDTLGDTFKRCDIPMDTWQRRAMNCCNWKSASHGSLKKMDDTRQQNKAAKRT